jgi:G3E family GTPase
LRSADFIIANHCDQATDEERAGMRSWLAREVPGVPCHETSNAEVPLELLTSLALKRDGGAPRGNAESLQPAHVHLHDDPHHGSQFDHWECAPVAPLQHEALRAWIASPPAGVLRLKGIVPTVAAGAMLGWYEIQFAGRRGSMKRAAAPSQGAEVVAIGLSGQLPIRELDAAFSANS